MSEGFFEDDYAEEPAQDDLSGVSEEETLPEAGWYRAKILAISTKPTKKGAAMRTATIQLNGTNGYEIREYFAIGVQGKGGEFAKRRYRILARCAGVEENDDGEFLFTTSDLEGAEIYVRTEVEKTEGYDPSLKAKEFRPLTEEPDELVATDEGDGAPF
jgi:hypothetical protein